MKQYAILPILLSVITIAANAQTKIKDGTVISATLPVSNAILELESTNKGFIPPRVALTSTTDIITIANPVDGMITYNTATTALATPTNVTPGLYYFSNGSWRKVALQAPSQGGNASVQSAAYVGVFTGQSTNGITLGDFSFRVFRRSDAVTYTTSNDQMDAQVKYNGVSSPLRVGGYASTMWAGGQYDYSSSTSSVSLGNLFAPTATSQSITRNNNLLNTGTWYGCGEPGFITDGSTEKRQYVFTPEGANYFYRVEFTLIDGTAVCGGCNVGNPSENDAKVIMYVELINAE